MTRQLTRRARTTRDTDDYVPEEPEDYTEPEEDEQEEAPRRRVSRRAATRPPARRDSSTRPPSRRSRSRSDEEEDEAPRRPRRAATRRSRDEDDARPARRSGGRTRSTRGGWESFRSQRRTGGFPDRLEITNEEMLIKFLDEEPFEVFYQHWIQEAPSKRKSWTCLGEDCPLCDEVGDRPRMRVLFNVVDLSQDEPKVVVWEANATTAETLAAYAEDDKTAPLNRADLYWSVVRTGKGTKTSYNPRPVKERDVEEDYDIEPLTGEEIEELAEGAFDGSCVSRSDREELFEVVDEILGN